MEHELVTSLLQTNRYDNLGRRVGSTKDQQVITGILEDIFPTISLEDLPPELQALAGWLLSGAAAQMTAAGAGTFAKSRLSNPVGSGKLIVLERIIVSSAAALFVVTGPSGPTANLAVVDSEIYWDRRLRGAPAGTVTHEVTAGSPTATHSFRMAADSPVIFEPKAVLEPDSFYQVSTTIQNVDLFASYFWRERTAEASELRI